MQSLSYFLQRIIILAVSVLFFTGCVSILDSSKYNFSDGIYSSSTLNNQKKKFYIDNEEDSLFIYPLKMVNDTFTIDTSLHKALSIPQNKSLKALPSFSFRQNSFDIDFLTILIKIRPSAGNIPPQFNTNLNGAAYFGYRTDIYRITYNETPLKFYNRRTTHYGFSFGGFLGVGSTNINPYVTNNHVNEEYDGIILIKGIAGMLGINNFNIGLTLGFDTLPDKNRKFWIYQHQPWLGFALGLNLN